MHIAAYQSHDEILKLLVEAANLGHDEVVKSLLEAGAPVDHVNNLGWIAKLEAVILGDGSAKYIRTVRHLLESGGNFTGRWPGHVSVKYSEWCTVRAGLAVNLPRSCVVGASGFYVRVSNRNTAGFAHCYDGCRHLWI